MRAFLAACVVIPAALAVSGDAVPRNPSVLNVAIEVPTFSDAAVQSTQLSANAAQLRALGDLESQTAAEVAGYTARSRKSFLEESPAVLGDIEKALLADCGDECVKLWDHMKAAHSGADLPSLVKNIVQAEMQKATQLAQQLQTQTSFLEASWSPVNAPCGDAKSCGLVEGVANTCSYGRVATLAAYQGVNLAVHVLGVVTKVVCGCLDVWRVSVCMLGPVLPPCNPIFDLYAQLLSASSQVYEGVKGMTDKCKVIGDVRAIAGGLTR